VCRDLLLLRCVGQSGVEICTLSLAENERKDVERELTLVAAQLLGLLSEESHFELAASLHRLQVERPILVALSPGGDTHFFDADDALLELFEPAHDFVDARHVLFMIDARSAVNGYRP